MTTTAQQLSGVVTSQDGTRIAYDQRGRGPAIILVGGAFSDRGWRGEVDLATALADRYTTITYDRRGRGNSPAAQPVYDKELEVQDLGALVERFDAPYVYGMSSGGVLVLHALAAGLPAAKAAVYDPPFVRSGFPPADYAVRIQALLERDDPAAAATYFLTRVIGMPGFLIPMMKLTSGWKRAVRLASSLPYDADTLGDFRVPAAFAKIAKPVLAIGGTKSPKKLGGALADLTSVVPGARSVLLPGQNHDPKPRVLAPVLRGFFAAD
jgi:pimeloyl-ACP methyl ester carboxylesterase